MHPLRKGRILQNFQRLGNLLNAHYTSRAFSIPSEVLFASLNTDTSTDSPGEEPRVLVPGKSQGFWCVQSLTHCKAHNC